MFAALDQQHMFEILAAQAGSHAFSEVLGKWRDSAGPPATVRAAAAAKRLDAILRLGHEGA
jgi:hypothetical protein